MNRKQIRDKNRVVDLGQYTNLQQRPSFDSYYPKNTKYYSGIDAEIFIGDKYIDEIYNIDYNIVQEHKPLFGYNSYLYDEMAVGSRIVSGSFAINFTETNYLGKVLDLIKKRKIIAGADRPLNAYNHKTYYQDKTMDRTVVESKHPIWDQQFEILVAYGEKRRRFEWQKDNIEIIEGVQLTSRSTRFDAVGNPIQEIYTFTGRNIRYEAIQKNNLAESPSQVKEEIFKEHIKISNASYKIIHGPINESVNAIVHGSAIHANMNLTCLNDKIRLEKAIIIPKYRNKNYQAITVNFPNEKKENIARFTIKDIIGKDKYINKDDIDLSVECHLYDLREGKRITENKNTKLKFNK